MRSIAHSSTSRRNAARRPAHDVLGFAAPRPRLTAYTISLGTPERMAADAAAATGRPLLKIKLGGDGDPERIVAVRARGA